MEVRLTAFYRLRADQRITRWTVGLLAYYLKIRILDRLSSSFPLAVFFLQLKPAVQSP